MNWNSLVVIVCVMVAALAVWKEYVRPDKANFILRISAVLLAVIALACIAIPLTYNADVLQSGKQEAILLTPGFNADSLNKYNNSRLFTIDNTIKSDKVKWLSSVNELTSDSTITSLRILGDGLNEDQLQQLNHLPVVFKPEELKQGITAISWNEKLKAGDELIVQGSFKNSSTKKVKLLLRGLSTSLDSVIVEPNSSADIHLKNAPKISGRAVFDLLTIAGNDTLEKEDIPIQIEPSKPLNVLLLTSSPDFESRFLKNWLSESGFGVAVRSAISKGKISTEFINQPKVSLDHLSAQVLSKFDVLISDLAVLKSLKGQEAAALKSEVTQNGLGIITKPDSTLRSDSWLQSSFATGRLQGRDTIPSFILVTGNDQKLGKLSNSLVDVKFQTGSQPLIHDEHNHILASSILSGSGKVIFMTLNSTFNWVLSGNKNNYTALWSLLINKTARKVPGTERWNVSTAIPTVSSPVSLQAQGTVSKVQLVGKVTLSPQQNPLLPFENKYTYWPQNAGWHSIKMNNGSLNWWYVYHQQDWKSLRILKKQTDTKSYIAKNAIMNNVTKQIQKKARNTVPKIYFYVLLLITSTFLWAEAKLSQAVSSSIKQEVKNNLKI
ncbi:hypothetical protein [Mucilaginibacter aquaedulcis]|uniref:hypothetical protein n=1 Tax=Mucilaginibacter aquaedulcis TaxID=1187081 RepID=UPI0025B51544|nr:hypothetical protein [Mucilaginibacter aquaedulcis]MDN3547678.1 hypothetical protein [Mucilaginibacter aquaedulcis]